MAITTEEEVACEGGEGGRLKGEVANTGGISGGRVGGGGAADRDV